MKDSRMLEIMKVIFVEVQEKEDMLSKEATASVEEALSELDPGCVEFYKLAGNWPTEADQKKMANARARLTTVIKSIEETRISMSRNSSYQDDYDYYESILHGNLAQKTFWEDKLSAIVKKLVTPAAKKKRAAKQLTVDKEVAEILAAF